MLPNLVLPHSSLFTRLLLGPREKIRLSLRDSSNYYYLLRVPRERLPFQAVGPAISKIWWENGCPDWPCDRVFVSDLRACVQPVFLGVCMGDTNGVLVGQETHQTILRRGGVLFPHEEIFMGRSAPQGELWSGVCIDDLALVQKVSADTKGKVLRDEILLDQADKVYATVGLPEKNGQSTTFS